MTGEICTPGAAEQLTKSAYSSCTKLTSIIFGIITVIAIYFLALRFLYKHKKINIEQLVQLENHGLSALIIIGAWSSYMWWI